MNRLCSQFIHFISLLQISYSKKEELKQVGKKQQPSNTSGLEKMKASTCQQTVGALYCQPVAEALTTEAGISVLMVGPRYLNTNMVVYEILNFELFL